MNVLVTGAGGFVGRHLVTQLAGQGHAVWGLSRRPAGRAGGLQWLSGDLGDAEKARAVVAASRPACVYHLAAQTPANAGAGASQRSWLEGDPLAMLNLLEAVRQVQPTARVLVVSSSAVYGHVAPAEQPVREDRPLAPTTLYGVSKGCVELLARWAVDDGRLDVVVARTFNLVGPGEPETMLTSQLARQFVAIERGAPPVVRLRHRATSRDYCDVRDAVRAYTLLAEQGQPGQAYNVCSGAATSIGELVARLARLTSREVRVEETGPAPGTNDIASQAGDPQRLTAATRWRPTVGLDRSLADLLEALRASSGSGRS